jgi:hypothetical protein
VKGADVDQPRFTYDESMFAVRNPAGEIVATVEPSVDGIGERIALALNFVACMGQRDLEGAAELRLCPMHNVRGSAFCAVQGGTVETDPRAYCTECGLYPQRDQTIPCTSCGNESDPHDPGVDDDNDEEEPS